MIQGKNKIDDFIVKTYYKPMNGIRMVISSEGLVCSEKTISKKAKEKIIENISRSFDNIPEGWFVEGEYKNDNFYVLYVINEKKEILGIEETIEWSKIFELCAPIHNNKINCDIEKFNNIEIRPTRKFNKFDLIKKFNKYGIETNINWRSRAKEIFYGKCISNSSKKYNTSKKV